MRKLLSILLISGLGFSPAYAVSEVSADFSAVSKCGLTLMTFLVTKKYFKAAVRMSKKKTRAVDLLAKTLAIKNPARAKALQSIKSQLRSKILGAGAIAGTGAPAVVTGSIVCLIKVVTAEEIMAHPERALESEEFRALAEDFGTDDAFELVRARLEAEQNTTTTPSPEIDSNEETPVIE